MNAPDALIALSEVLGGDTSSVGRLKGVAQEDLLLAARGSRLVLKRDVVATVLERYANGAIAAIETQEWASFVRRGYFAGNLSGGVKSVEIDYDPPYEDSIAEVIGRLDELGDLVDGEIDRAEAAGLLALLRP